MDDWRSVYIGSQSGSVRTRQALVQDLTHFERWYSAKYSAQFHPQDLTQFDLQAYRKQCLEVDHCAPATWNRRLASMVKFARWARMQGHIAYDVTENIESKKVQQLSPRSLSEQDLGRIMRQVERNLNAARTSSACLQAARDQAMIYLMAYCGLRESEVVGLEISDVVIGERSGSVMVRSGKGDKYRRIPMNKETRRALSFYLDLRIKNTEPHVRDLFVGKSGSPLGARGIQRRVQEIGSMCSVQFTPHMLRHTFAKRMLDRGAQLTVVAAALGHTRLDTTMRYTIPSEHDLALAVERL